MCCLGTSNVSSLGEFDESETNLDLSMSFRLIYVSYACVFRNLASDLIIIVTT